MTYDFKAKHGVFVALDGMEFIEVMRLLDKLCTPETEGMVGFKANDLLYHPHFGAVVACVHSRRAPLFVDAKLHDIPNTVFNTARRLTAEYRPRYLTVHASGGAEMVKAARIGSSEHAQFHHFPSPTILAVTVLTSLGAAEVSAIYNQPDPTTQVLRLAEEVWEEASGVVCSPEELTAIMTNSDFAGRVKVVPGIRPEWSQAKGDQKRVATPAEAIRDGATHLVIGRPITQAADPLSALKKTLEEIANVC